MQWTKCSDSLPPNGQDCLIYSEDADQVTGPVMYDEGKKGWLDLSASVHSGHLHKPSDKGNGLITHWTKWEDPTNAG